MSEIATEMTPDLIPAGSSMARVASAAADAGLSIRILKMAQSTRTAEEAAEAAGCHVSQIVKSLVFENSATGQLNLMLVSGAHNADMDYISKNYNLSFTRCDARRVRDETGFAIGGVAPIGHLTPITVYMDRTLLDHAEVWAAAGRPDSVFRVDPQALATAIKAEIIDVRAQG
ncbi:MAG: YbaK/EbsC family protein [Hoeflea sp.]|uniref:YbaK/EbsC family protein n=1 Tax=Hoeflea sp. TaxID=1940281 RepID=UPI001DFCD98E|nr:YbaK/EbsC family protein [Hoeflea sp.]MBU4529494.1 YbaK/EbsC family protein [Alphaproteobacteria bacterium]MBU4546613.1 YbaK/EbsC family protein [Alphaproteobacteria bacterium]MBU4550881.1 YbaK/EbsC family protein [Alphaproteobacteria bacterium]MBV1723823.1 YbaK/EbsC family protein [Hoeflea sp.]MBV1763100.1 YbaK/EbsC family protein [Hoeflea sp.]